MKRLGLVRGGLVALACLGMLLPAPALRAATGPADAGRHGAGAVPSVIDVALGEGGTLQGQVVDAQGKPLDRVPVSIWQSDRQIVSAATDKGGHFRVIGLHGGTYRIVAGEVTGVYRLWAPDTAPPAARPGALLVAGDQEVLLGQGNRFLRVLRNPWVVAGIVAAAIAIPIALHNIDDDDEGPKTPH